MARARGWCFTANLPDEDEIDTLEEPIPGVHYMVWQYEEKSHRHIQGYAYWKNQRTMSAAKKSIFQWCGVQAHLEKAMGTPLENKTYCTKEESRIAGPYEFGDMPTQGERTDIQTLWDTIKKNDGMFTDEQYEEQTQAIASYGRRLKEMYNERGLGKQKELLRDLKVTVFYGDPGTGKSCKAIMDNPGMDYYKASYVRDKEFSTYNGEKLVIFDEFKGQIPIDRMKELLDKLAVNVMVMYKGAVPFKPSKIYVISNYAMSDWWETISHVDQLALSRRVDEIYKFTGHYDTEVVIEKVK